MSAFGRRPGPTGNGAGTGARPAFGVARPMHGTTARAPEPNIGGEQFPPLPVSPMPGEIDAPMGNMPGTQQDAMQRLSDRQNASGEAGNSRVEGFERDRKSVV